MTKHNFCVNRKIFFRYFVTLYLEIVEISRYNVVMVQLDMAI